MFSGITECIGQVLSIQTHNDCYHFVISHHGRFDDVKVGDSIAVNGVCLTVTAFDENTFSTTAVPETLRLTNLSLLNINDPVNLERAIRADHRVGGHTVQGHIDTMATVKSITRDGNDAWVVHFTIDPTWQRYLVNKGFITIDGMSITVINAHDTEFSVTFIPHTKTSTIVQHYQPGTLVNIEVDMMAKYIEKMMKESPQ